MHASLQLLSAGRHERKSARAATRAKRFLAPTSNTTRECRGNSRMRSLMTTAALLTALTSGSQAGDDWLRWNDRDRGPPYILFNSDGVEVTMPEGMMAEAVALGLTTNQAITAFLNRYAAHVCNGVGPDMNVSHIGLAVKVSFTQKDERYAPVPFFVTKGEPVTYAIDYVPEKRVECILSSENVPQY